jgi:protein subunit release factor B
MMRRFGTTQVRMTHIPTGLVAIAEYPREGFKWLVQCTRVARSILAAKLAKRSEDPKWIDCGQSEEQVRSYHLATCPGVPAHIRDDRTGKSFAFTPDVFDGRIDDLLKESTKARKSHEGGDSWSP